MRLLNSPTLRNSRLGMTAAGVIAVTLAWITVAQQPVSAGKPAAGPAKCTDVPLEVAVIAGGAIADDGKGTYKHRVDGVYNTVIHLCGSNPTYDATMGLINSKRSMKFTFPAPIDGSALNIPPSWVPGTITAKPFMNIRKILWGRMNNQLEFTTGMGFSYFKGPGDTSDYRLQFLPDTDATDPDPNDPEANQPNIASSVTVLDMPGNCRDGGTTLDSWLVTVHGPSVGTLRRDTSSGLVQVGQYDMPFQLMLKAKSCVPASVSGGY